MKNSQQKEITFFDNLVKKIIPFIPLWVKPNHITVLRFFLIIILVWLFLHNYFLLSLIIFLLAASTDAIDGALARQRQQMTKFGAAIDPLTDKILIVTLIILFAKFLPWQIVGLILAAELCLIIGAAILYKRKLKIKANIYGKLKMNGEILAIILLFIKLIWQINWLNQLIIIILSLAIILAVLSVIRHFKDA